MTQSGVFKCGVFAGNDLFICLGLAGEMSVTMVIVFKNVPVRETTKLQMIQNYVFLVFVIANVL